MYNFHLLVLHCWKQINKATELKIKLLFPIKLNLHTRITQYSNKYFPPIESKIFILRYIRFLNYHDFCYFFFIFVYL